MPFVNFQDVNFERYDVFVAGSGPAGAVVAKHLAAAGKQVLVVETGGRDFDANVQDAYAAVYSQGHYIADYWSRHWIRSLGGTSSVWAGWVTPLLERNLKNWPLSRKDLEPWYRIAAEELERSQLTNTWSAPSIPGFDFRPFSQSQAAHYGYEAGDAIWANDNVHVLLNTTLSRLHSGSNRRGIEKITLFSAPDLEADVELADTQNVVLAAGGMGNAQILLASDDGTGAAVGNERDQVGRYLMEHPHLPNCATFVLRSDFSLGNPPVEFGGSFPVLVPNDELFFDTDEIDASFEIIEAQLDVDDAIQQFVIERLGGEAKAFSLFGRSEMMADPENRVRRIAATDPAGLPRLKATCVVDSSSIRSMLTYLERLGVSLSEQGVGRLRINDLDLMASLSGGGHTMGTTRMGTDPATSVTDPNCRVHGYRNLFVAGSSLFPTGGYANPTLTIIALAARLGDFLGKAA